jgi:predicted nucleotidyltransferase
MGVLEFYRGLSGGILPGFQADLEEVLEKLKILFQRSGVALAYLFGSHARGEAKPASDIDIAVLIKPEDAQQAFDSECSHGS